MSSDLYGESSDPKVKSYLRDQSWLATRIVLKEIYDGSNAGAIAEACGLNPSHLSTAINAPFGPKAKTNDRHLNDLHVLVILSFATHDQFRRYYDAALGARGMEATEKNPPTMEQRFAKLVFQVVSRCGEEGKRVVAEQGAAP